MNIKNHTEMSRDM